MKYIVNSFVFLSLIILAGCMKKSDGNTFVTGTVTKGGTPLADARVIFIPDDETGESAGGRTDTEGKFVLTTSTGNAGSGTKPGAYRVTVMKTKAEWDGKSYLPRRDGYPDEPPLKDEKFIQLLPARYGNFASTPFKATVTTNKDDNVFEFALP